MNDRIFTKGEYYQVKRGDYLITTFASGTESNPPWRTDFRYANISGFQVAPRKNEISKNKYIDLKKDFILIYS